MSLISVIIPVYNGEKYIKTAVQSVLEQPFEPLEIIIVNDGSADRTGQIAEKFAAENENISVIHQENQGVSVARNEAIEAARGRYLLFLDADDSLVSGSLDESIVQICNGDYDIIWFSSYLSNVKRSRFRIELALKDFEFPGGRILSQEGHFGSCLYRKEMLAQNKIAFDKGVRLSEDLVFKMKALYYAKKM